MKTCPEGVINLKLLSVLNTVINQYKWDMAKQSKFFCKGEGEKQGVGNQGVEAELQRKAIRTETDGKSSRSHGTHNLPGLVLGALHTLSWDGDTYFCFINEKMETQGV